MREMRRIMMQVKKVKGMEKWKKTKRKKMWYYLMNFVLQLDNVACEDDKSDIQRLWKKEWEHVNNTKKI